LLMWICEGHVCWEVYDREKHKSDWREWLMGKDIAFYFGQGLIWHWKAKHYGIWSFHRNILIRGMATALRALWPYSYYLASIDLAKISHSLELQVPCETGDIHTMQD
jgi:hypothetical protein